MGLIQSVGRALQWLGRSMENPRRPLDPWSQAMGDSLDGSLASAGIRVNRDKALGYPPFWRAVNLISRTVAKLPLGVYRHVRPGREPDPDHPGARLLRAPCEGMTPFVWKQLLAAHLLTEGNGYAYLYRRADGSPIEALPLNPERTYPVRENGRLWVVHELKGGELRRLDPADVLHFKGLSYDGLEGYRVLSKAKESVGLGLGQQAFASIFFRNNARPNVVLQHPSKLSPEARKNLKESWERMHGGLDNSHRTAILEEGMVAKELSINARDSQLLEGRQFSLIETANLFNLPPHRLGANVSTSYGSLEQENQNFLDDAIDPWLVAIEEECEAKLLTTYQQARGTHQIAFDRFPLVRADLQQRGEFYSKALQSGWLCPDEARAREGLNPMPGGLGRTWFFPLNAQAVGGDPDGPAGGAVAPGAELIPLPDLRQAEDYDCGPAAVQAVCQYFGVGPGSRQGYLDALETTTRGGTRPAAIVAFLGRLSGVVTTAASGLGVEDLARFFAAGHPVLCPIQAGDGNTVGHWVVVIGTGLGMVFVHDPATGRDMYTEEDWVSRWRDRDADGVGYEQYGIAVGQELLSAPLPPEEGETNDPPVPPDEEGAGTRLRRALQGALAETVGRLVRRLGHSARGAAKKPAGFVGWLDTLEAEHGEVCREALRYPVEARVAAGESTDSPEALTSALLARVRGDLLDLSGRVTADGLVAAVESHFADLESRVSELTER